MSETSGYIGNIETDPRNVKPKEREPLPVRPESAGSIHILFKLRWGLGGFVDARPIEAFTTRKKANAKMREKNSKATSCDYVVKSVKLSE